MDGFWKKTYTHIYIYKHLLVFFLRPNDSRMLVALGESYEKLSQQAEAKKVHIYPLPVINSSFCSQFQSFWLDSNLCHGFIFVKCYWRAYSVGDVEKMALLKLAK